MSRIQQIKDLIHHIDQVKSSQDWSQVNQISTALHELFTSTHDENNCFKLENERRLLLVLTRQFYQLQKQFFYFIDTSIQKHGLPMS